MLFTVDPDQCDGDGLCVEACAPKIIKIRGQGALPTPVEGGEAYCIDCGHCVAVCPRGALSRDTLKPEDCAPIDRSLRINDEQALQFFRSRRSIRSYRERPVERQKLDRLIQIAGYAPSAHNARAVGLVVAEDSDAVRHISGLVIDWLRSVVRESPAVAQSYGFDQLVRRWDRGIDLISRGAPHLFMAHGPRKATMAREDCLLALAHVELAAVPLGLGATWAGYIMAAMRSYPPLGAALGLPDGDQCHAVLMVGYPQFKYARLPVRRPPPVVWHKAPTGM